MSPWLTLWSPSASWAPVRLTVRSVHYRQHFYYTWYYHIYLSWLILYVFYFIIFYVYRFSKIFFLAFVWLYWSERDVTEMSADRGRERGETRSKGPRAQSNPGPLKRGQSICTWDARSTNWTEWRPILCLMLSTNKPLLIPPMGWLQLCAAVILYNTVTVLPRVVARSHQFWTSVWSTKSLHSSSGTFYTGCLWCSCVSVWCVISQLLAGA